MEKDFSNKPKLAFQYIKENFQLETLSFLFDFVLTFFNEIKILFFLYF